MEILSSRILLRPRDFARSVAFYGEVLGLHVYREWGSGAERGVVFFVGNGLLEISRRSERGPSPAVELWLQVPDLAAAHRALEAKGVAVDEPPERKPWGLLEMHLRDPDGLGIVMVEVPEDHPLRRRPPGT